MLVRRTFEDLRGSRQRFGEVSEDVRFPSKRERALEQEVEALRLSVAIAASLKPSSDGSLHAGDPDPNQNHQGGKEKEPGPVSGIPKVGQEEPEDGKALV